MKSNLFESLQEEISLVLLFLKNIENISIEIISEEGKSECLVDAKRVQTECPNGLKRVTIEEKMRNHAESFLISEADSGILNPDSDDVAQLKELCQQLKVKDQVQVGAFLAENGKMTRSDLQGRVSVLLPLPSSQATATKLPVNVNGFFALSDNRRVLKLETSDDHGYEVRDKERERSYLVV